ncbi:hypothetical protein DFH11DRAFT_971934 [Phellopilus nigrolimitatus]|nr:hypothetical protein DFH11DRAFT_971934 [Phellopilus nigrolimitatus]
MPPLLVSPPLLTLPPTSLSTVAETVLTSRIPTSTVFRDMFLSLRAMQLSEGSRWARAHIPCSATKRQDSLRTFAIFRPFLCIFAEARLDKTLIGKCTGKGRQHVRCERALQPSVTCERRARRWFLNARPSLIKICLSSWDVGPLRI